MNDKGDKGLQGKVGGGIATVTIQNDTILIRRL